MGWARKLMVIEGREYIHVNPCMQSEWPEAVSSERYSVLYYKNNKTIGLRRKFDKRDTALSFGRNESLSEESLRKVADECLRKLNGGDTEANVKIWADAQVKPK